MPDPKDFLPQLPWDGPPIPRGPFATGRQRSYIARLSQQTGDPILHEEEVETMGEAGVVIRRLEARRKKKAIKLKKIISARLPGSMSRSEAKAIAEKLGIKFEEYQEGLGWQFTDIGGMGTTFYANSPYTVRKRLKESRELFGFRG